MNIQLGQAIVHTTSNGGHDIDFYVERIADRMIYIGDTAPEPIREQARMFREKLMVVAKDGLTKAIQSDRLTMANELMAQGYGEAAAYILRRK